MTNPTPDSTAPHDAGANERTPPAPAARVAFPPALEQIVHALGWPTERLRTPRGFERPVSTKPCPPRVLHADTDAAKPPPAPNGNDDAESASFHVTALTDDGGVRQLLLLHTPLANVLPTRHHLMAHAIDTAPPLDRLCETARAIAGSGEHALICDAAVFHLVDLDREELLLSGDREPAWGEYLLPVLSGSRATLRRRLSGLPRRSDLQLGIELRRFLDRSGERLAHTAGRSEAEGALLALGLLASAHRWRFDPRPSPSAPKRIWDVAAWSGGDATHRANAGRRDAPATGAPGDPNDIGGAASWLDLNLLAATLESDYRAAPLAAFRLGDRARWTLDWCGLATADHRAAAAEVLLDYHRLAPMRLRQEVYEVALLDEAQLHLATRLRVQSGPVTLASSGLAHDAATIYRPATLDYATDGVGRVIDTVRFFLEYWTHQQQLQSEAARSGKPSVVVLDLFQEGSPGAGGEGRIEDPVMTTLYDSVRVTGVPAEQRPAIELLIATTVWDWAWRSDGAAPLRQHDRPLSLASLGRVFA